MRISRLRATVAAAVLASGLVAVTPAALHAVHVAAAAGTDHPRLLFSAADVPALRDRITSGVPAQAWASLKRKADAWTDPTNPAYVDPALVSDPTPQHNPDWAYYNGLLGQNQMGVYLTDLGFAYVLSGDARYGRHAVDLLLAEAAAGWPAWDKNELGKGDLTKGVGLAFDWTYDLMTAAERASIVGSLTSHEQNVFSCLYSSFQFDYGGGPGLNWDSVCGGGNGIALLAIEGEPGAPADIETRLDVARERVLQTFTGQIGSRGDGGEGLNYLAYGLHNAFPFAFAWQRARGEDLLASYPGFTQIARHLAYEQEPGMGEMYLPRNDSNETLLLFQEVLPMLFQAHPDSTVGWVWDHTVGAQGDDLFGRPDPAYVGQPVAGSPQCTTPGQVAEQPVNAAFCWNSAETFTILYWRSPTDLPRADPATTGPLSQLYPERGLVDFRTGWSGGIDEVTGSFEAKHDQLAGHYQEDLGQFTLYGYGAGFALDSGYGHNYSCNSTTAIYQGGCPTTDDGHAVGHNVVIIDGDRYTQRWDGALAHGDTILGYLDTADGTQVQSDLRSAYAADVTTVPDAGRDLMFSRAPGEPVLLAVTDHLQRDGGTHAYQWRLHTDAANAVALTGPSSFLVTAASGATMAGAVSEASAAPVLAIEPWQMPADARPAQLLLVSQTASAQPRFDHLAVLSISGPGSVPATVTPSPATGGEVTAVSWTGGSAFVAARAWTAPVVSGGGLTTDAEMVKVDRSGRHLMFTDGSTLVLGGRTIVSITGGRGSVATDGHGLVAQGPAGAQFTVRVPGAVGRVTVNGAAVGWVRRGTDIVFAAPAA